MSTAATSARRAPTLAGRLVSALTSGLGRVVVLGLVVVWTLPTLGLLVSSVRPADDVRTTGWWTVLADPLAAGLTLEHYRDVLQPGAPDGGMLTAFVATVAIAVPATVITLVLAALAAYAFAWLRFPGRHWWFLGVIGLMVVPVQLALVPLLDAYTNGVAVGGVTLVPDLGLAGSWVGLWLAHAAFGLPLAVFVLHNTMVALPADVIDASRADGAGPVDVFLRLVVPLSAPALVAVGVFQLLWVWNDYLVALTLLGGAESDSAPLAVRLAALAGRRGEAHHLLGAATMVSVVVPLLVFVALRRWFERAVLGGAVKG